MIEIRFSREEGEGTPRTVQAANAWVAIEKAQKIAVNHNRTAYIWDDNVPVATVYPHGRIVVTL